MAKDDLFCYTCMVDEEIIRTVINGRCDSCLGLNTFNLDELDIDAFILFMDLTYGKR